MNTGVAKVSGSRQIGAPNQTLSSIRHYSKGDGLQVERFQAATYENSSPHSLNISDLVVHDLLENAYQKLLGRIRIESRTEGRIILHERDTSV